jgi:hypothetical protein
MGKLKKILNAHLWRRQNLWESTMRDEVLSLVAVAALLGSMGAAEAKEPVKLTDAQLDMATAGIGNTGTVLTPNALNFGISLPSFGATGPLVASVSMVSSMNGMGIIQANQSTGANAVQQNSVSTASGGF